MAAAVVTLEFNGVPPGIKKFKLHDGRLMMQTVRSTFNLGTVEFNGVVADTDAQGFSCDVFKGGDTISVTGDPPAGGHEPIGLVVF